MISYFLLAVHSGKFLNEIKNLRAIEHEFNVKKSFETLKSQYTNDFIFELEPDEQVSFQQEGTERIFFEL